MTNWRRELISLARIFGAAAKPVSPALNRRRARGCYRPLLLATESAAESESESHYSVALECTDYLLARAKVLSSRHWLRASVRALIDRRAINRASKRIYVCLYTLHNRWKSVIEFPSEKKKIRIDRRNASLYRARRVGAIYIFNLNILDSPVWFSPPRRMRAHAGAFYCASTGFYYKYLQRMRAMWFLLFFFFAARMEL